MESFYEYEGVRIVRLLKPERCCQGTEGVHRPPRVGDTGTIVHIDSHDQDVPYWVEKVDVDGYTIWFAIFAAEELGRA